MIEINWPLLITQVVTFLVAMVLVWKFSWGPLTNMMNERSQKIQSDIDQADQKRNEIEALETDYHRRVAEIEEKSRKTLAEAVQRGYQEKELILQEARHEAQRLLEKNQTSLLQQREQVIKELRDHISEIAIMAVERLVGERADDQVHAKLMNNFMDELDKVEK